MGLKSYTLEISSKLEYLNFYQALYSIADVIEVEPLLHHVGAINYKSKNYLLIAVNCTDSTAKEVIEELRLTYNLKGNVKRLEQWASEYTPNGYKITGANYFDSEENLYKALKG